MPDDDLDDAGDDVAAINNTQHYITGRQRTITEATPNIDKMVSPEENESPSRLIKDNALEPVQPQRKRSEKEIIVGKTDSKANKKVDPLEIEKKKQADVKDAEEEEKEDAVKKKLEKEGFMSRLSPYNKPFINVIIGTIVSVIQGGIFPVFGVFITKMLFALF